MRPYFFFKNKFKDKAFSYCSLLGYVTKFAESEGVEFSLIPLNEMNAGKKSFLEKANYLLDSLKCAEIIDEFIDLWRIDLIFANGPRIYLPSVIGAKKFSLKVHLQLHLLFERGIEKCLIETLLKTETVKSGVVVLKRFLNLLRMCIHKNEGCSLLGEPEISFDGIKKRALKTKV